MIEQITIVIIEIELYELDSLLVKCGFAETGPNLD